MPRQLIDSLFLRDTLPWHAAPQVIPAVETVRENAMSTAEAVYGPSSVLFTPDAAMYATASNPAPLTGNVFYDVAVIACFIAFCLVVYFFRDYVGGIFNIFRGTSTTDKMLGEQSKVFGAFLVWVISLGMVITGLSVLKFADILYGEHIGALSGWGALGAILGAIGTAALIWGYQFVFLKVAGSLTLSQGFVARLFYLKKVVAAIGTLAVLPVFLLFALSEGQSANTLGIIVAGIAALTMIFLIIRTFMLFIRQNFSILLWFLYLCAVEIFPVSLAVIVALKVLG